MTLIVPRPDISRVVYSECNREKKNSASGFPNRLYAGKKKTVKNYPEIVTECGIGSLCLFCVVSLKDEKTTVQLSSYRRILGTYPHAHR
jgi:hypothetical protein